MLTPDDCVVSEPGEAKPDVEIACDAKTWGAMYDGQLSGIEAFAQRRLFLRGSIEKSLYFEPSFDRPQAGGLRYELRKVNLGALEFATVMAGDPDAPPLLLLHGLGGTKASWLPIVPELASRYRVVALDLPGFGESSKPRGRHDAPWFSEYVFGVMDALGIDRAALGGNSLGGRIAMEMAMQEPRRVEAIACLCPATAFSRRPGLGIVKLLRPELGVVAAKLPRDQIKAGVKDMFANPLRIDESWYDAAVDDFLDIWKSPRARRAFFTTLRNVYLDEPEGELGFWNRLQYMRPPALYIYGRKDNLISHHFAKKVERYLPNATVKVWADCGHVPQIECPERTVKAMLDFYDIAGAKSIAG